MNRITDSELELTHHNIYMDFLKSNYILNAENLMMDIFNSKKDMTLESEKEIKDTMKYLVNSKEELVNSIDECIKLVNRLSHEIEDYLMEAKNDIQ